jgi:hypothetical protein
MYGCAQYVSGLLDLIISPENNIHKGDPKVLSVA